jgi:hypothetical protein
MDDEAEVSAVRDGPDAWYRLASLIGGPGNFSPVDLSHAEAHRLVEQLERSRHACGCKVGAVAVVVGFIGQPLRLAFAGLPTTAVGWLEALGVWLVVVVVGAVAGKLTGIAVGRLRFILLRACLRAKWLACEDEAPAASVGSHR